MLYERYYNLLWFQNCYCSFTWLLWTFHIAIELVRSFRELFLTHVFTFVLFFSVNCWTKKTFPGVCVTLLNYRLSANLSKMIKKIFVSFSPQKAVFCGTYLESTCTLWVTDTTVCVIFEFDHVYAYVFAADPMGCRSIMFSTCSSVCACGSTYVHSPFGLSASSFIVTLLPVVMRSVHDRPDWPVICQMRQWNI